MFEARSVTFSDGANILFVFVVFLNTLHAEIICTSPFINAEIKIICLKWQVLLSKP